MKVTICYFAMLREQARRDEETRETNAATVAALYAELAQAYQFTIPVTALRAAVNGAFVPMNTALRDGDEVTFIPPVAGG
jgi:molybdopterin converting factor subunit 1